MSAGSLKMTTNTARMTAGVTIQMDHATTAITTGTTLTTVEIKDTTTTTM